MGRRRPLGNARHYWSNAGGVRTPCRLHVVPDEAEETDSRVHKSRTTNVDREVECLECKESLRVYRAAFPQASTKSNWWNGMPVNEGGRR